jgi:hypothetical protein
MTSSFCRPEGISGVMTSHTEICSGGLSVMDSSLHDIQVTSKMNSKSSLLTPSQTIYRSAFSERNDFLGEKAVRAGAELASNIDNLSFRNVPRHPSRRIVHLDNDFSKF